MIVGCNKDNNEYHDYNRLAQFGIDSTYKDTYVPPKVIDSRPVDSSISYHLIYEVYSDFRNNFPFHIQTIGTTNNELDSSFTLIISEPPSYISEEQISRIFSKYEYSHRIYRKIFYHPIGVDGWVKDICYVFNSLSNKNKEILISEINKLLFDTKYKSYFINLSEIELNKVKETSQNFKITAAEINDWFMLRIM